MHAISRTRLVLMRALYLIMFLGTIATQGPTLLHHTNSLRLMHGVASSLLLAMAFLALLGVRNPLQMLPLLLFELSWKTLWLAAFALPLWVNKQMDAETAESVKACLLGLFLCPIIIPWRYVADQYLRKQPLTPSASTAR